MFVRTSSNSRELKLARGLLIFTLVPGSFKHFLLKTYGLLTRVFFLNGGELMQKKIQNFAPKQFSIPGSLFMPIHNNQSTKCQQLFSLSTSTHYILPPPYLFKFLHQSYQTEVGVVMRVL